MKERDCVKCRHLNNVTVCMHCNFDKHLFDPARYSRVTYRSWQDDYPKAFYDAIDTDAAYVRERARTKNVDPFAIKKVIFNDPATIVLWKDGTKTVVKCQEGDTFDPEKGLSMAIAKKAYGNKGSYCDVIKKWTEPYEKQKVEEVKVMINYCGSELANAFNHLFGKAKDRKIDIL